MYMFDFIDLC